MTGRAVLAVAPAVVLLTVAAGTAAGWFGAGVVILVFAMGVGIGVGGSTYRSPAALMPRPRLGRPPTDPAVAALDRIAGALDMARLGPRWADTELRPQLARVTDSLLVARTGQALRDDPAGARAVLGTELFDFLDPDRPPRGHDDGRGLTTGELSRLISRLEDLT